MKPRTYKDLVFWQRTLETSRGLIKIARNLPRTLEVKIILNQVLRSCMSIGANIAEGYGRFGEKEFVRYLQVALGSANETEYWLILLIECCPEYKIEIEQLIEKNKEVIRMLASSIKTIRNKNIARKKYKE